MSWTGECMLCQEIFHLVVPYLVPCRRMRPTRDWGCGAARYSARGRPQSELDGRNLISRKVLPDAVPETAPQTKVGLHAQDEKQRQQNTSQRWEHCEFVT